MKERTALIRCIPMQRKAFSEAAGPLFGTFPVLIVTRPTILLQLC